MQLTEVAPYVAFQLPVPNLPCHGKRRFVMRPGLVQPSCVDVENPQVGKYAALALPVPRLPGRAKRFLEMRPSLAGPAEDDLHGAETVVNVALQRPVLHFACDDQ